MEFGISIKLVRLIKMCLTETYSRVRVGNNLSDLITEYFKRCHKESDYQFPRYCKTPFYMDVSSAVCEELMSAAFILQTHCTWLKYDYS
jgi:hypothetical protein